MGVGNLLVFCFSGVVMWSLAVYFVLFQYSDDIKKNMEKMI
jgi:hypothetical protein